MNNINPEELCAALIRLDRINSSSQSESGETLILELIKAEGFWDSESNLMEFEMAAMATEEYTLPLPNEHVSEEEDSCADQHHPLLNHAILEKVFEHLKRQDLRSCRAVCKKWNESSIPFIRSKYLITLDNLNVENFVVLCRESKMGIPFGSFDLRLLMTRNVIYQEFLSLCCGDTIQELSLLHCQELFVEDVGEILRSTPNLETFHTPGILGSCSGDIVQLFQEDTKPKLNSLKKLHVEFNFNGKRIKICATYLEEILRAAVNICDVSVNGVFTWIDEDGNPNCSTMKVLGLIEKLGRESSIKTLDLMYVSSQHIELLSRMASKGLKLEKFLFTLPKRVDKFQAFQAIYPFKHSLKSLDILTGACSMGLPYMPRLKELKFQIKKDFNFRDVNLKDIFPALETLNLFYPEGATKNLIQEFHEFFPNSEPCPTIKSLKLDFVSLKLKAFNDISRIFPNLIELKLKVSTTDGVEILRNISDGINSSSQSESGETLTLELINRHDQRIKDSEAIVMEMSEFNTLSTLDEQSDEEEDSFEEQYHPLLNYLILNNVFEYLRRQDLKACRAVCKKWNELSIPFIRSKYLISLHHSKIEKFVDCCRDNEFGIPFEKYFLRLLSLTDEIGQEFLSLCGNSIKEVSILTWNKVLTVEDVSEILRSTPNLESFHIPGIVHSNSVNIVKLFQEEDIKPKLNSLKKLRVHFDPPKKRINCPTFLEEIIRVAENICDLSVEGVDAWTDEDGNTHCPSMEVLGLVEKLGRESSIKTLDLMNVSTQHVELLSRMAQKGLRLEKLRFGHAEKVNAFQALNLFKHSLKSLDINMDTSSLDFWQMPRLTELEYKIKKDFNSRGVNLKTIFPALETMKLVYLEGSTGNFVQGFNEFFPDSDPCPNIKSLNLPYFPLRLNAFNNLRRVFPNLTELDLHVTITDGVEILRNLWTQMTELKVLTLTGEVQTTEDLDSIFTGIPTDLIRGLQDTQEITVLEKMTVECRRDTIEKMRNQNCHFNSITNLTKLRSLRISVTRLLTSNTVETERFGNLTLSENGIGSCLTDVSGYLAFYPMKHLRHLNIEESQFTKACCENLKTDMDLESSEILKKDQFDEPSTHHN